MVQIWYLDDSNDDQKDERHLSPPQFIDTLKLHKMTGVKYWEIDVDNIEEEAKFKNIRQERGYNYRDVVDLSRNMLPDYDDMMKIFYVEHIHADDEVRLFLNGSGYLDVRDICDKWIRIKAVKGDLLALPAGIYHRFTLDKTDYAKVMRLCSGCPVWTAIKRPADDHPSRKMYLENANNGFT